MTYLENYLWRALLTAKRFIPEPSEDASCHRGICNMQNCLRCTEAEFIYDAIKRGANADYNNIVEAELSNDSRKQ